MPRCRSPFDQVKRSIDGGAPAAAADVELVARRGLAAGVELSPYLRSLMGMQMNKILEMCEPICRNATIHRTSSRSATGKHSYSCLRCANRFTVEEITVDAVKRVLTKRNGVIIGDHAELDGRSRLPKTK